MREKVLRYIRERQLMRAGDRVAVAVSGGADSVALLRVLLELRAELGIVLAVAHFNHGLRGEASEADEAFVAELARQHDLEFFSGRGDVRDHALTGKLSVEAAARELRYCWLTSLAESHKLDEVATGHTLDDQAETVLLKFLRGAGTRGLAGIYPEIAIGAKAPGPFQSAERGPEETVPPPPIGLPRWKEADKNQPRMGRKSLAQHGAAGGVLGKRGNRSESRRDGRGCDTVSKVPDAYPSPGRGPFGRLRAGSESRLDRNPGQRLPGARIIRPLLGVTREEVEQYLTARGQTWREDESNLDHRFARNRVRHELLPLLEREYNPNIRQVLTDTAELARAEEEYWQALAERELEARQPSETEIPQGLRPSTGVAGDGTAKAVPFQISAAEQFPSAAEQHLSLVSFRALPLALQRRLLRRFVEIADLTLDFEHVEKLLRCALGELPKTELPGGWLVSRTGDRLELRPPQPAHSHTDYAYTLPVPGEVRIAEIGLTLRAVVVCEEFARENAETGNLLSAELLGPELIVRNWRPGDRFWPLHSKSEEKLKRLFSERHIPAEQRSSWPVVLCDSQIVWMHRFPAARAFAWSGSGDAVKIELPWGREPLASLRDSD